MAIAQCTGAKRSKRTLFSWLRILCAAVASCVSAFSIQAQASAANATSRLTRQTSLTRFQPKARYRQLAKASAESPTDIRELAPPRPAEMPGPMVVPPQSGSDLGSVGADWMQRQTSFLLDGADQRFLARLNKKVNRMLKFEPVKGEPWPEPDDETKGGGSSGGDGGDGSDDDPGRSFWEEDYFGLRPTSIRFLQANRVEFGWANRAQLNCAFTGDSVQFDLIKSLTDTVGLDLRHISNRGESSLHLNYSW